MENFGSFLPIVLMFVVLYFLMIRPQQKKQKEQRDMINALKEGDEIVTLGGLLGVVSKISENHISMQMASGAEVFVQKNAIVAQLPKGTLGSLDNQPENNQFENNNLLENNQPE